MRAHKIILSLMLSIIIICSSIVLQLSLSFKHDLFSEKFYLEKFEENKIYDKFEKSIDNTFLNYANKSKLPTSATEDIISNLWVQNQFQTVLHGTLSFVKNKSNTLPVIDTNTPTSNFDTNVTAKLNARNIPIDNSVLIAKKEFYTSFEIIPFTKSWNEIHGDSFKADLKHYRSYALYFNVAAFSSALILVGCVFLLFVVIKKLSSWKLWAGYSLILGGLIPSITAFIISNSNYATNYLNRNLHISKDSIYPHNSSINLLADIINNLFMNITKYAGAFVFLGITIIVIVSLIDSKKDNVFWYKHKPLKIKKGK